MPIDQTQEPQEDVARLETAFDKYLEERLLDPTFAAAYREALVQVRAEIASEQTGRVPEPHPECDDIGSCEEQCSNYRACHASEGAQPASQDVGHRKENGNDGN